MHKGYNYNLYTYSIYISKVLRINCAHVQYEIV